MSPYRLMKSPVFVGIGIVFCYHLANAILVYPNGGVYKLVIGLGMPIKVPNRSLGFAVNFQFQYSQLTNVSEVLQYFPSVVRGRHLTTRATAYRALETSLERKGAAGKECVLRAICEVAEAPLVHDGLIGEILHHLLTPENSLPEYAAARRLGESWGDCITAYPGCPPGEGLLDHISRLQE